jgi:drug/metabolite transporter (DMT)-like permease
MHIPTAFNTPDAFSTNLLELLTKKGGAQQPGGGDSQLQRWSSFIGIVTAIIGNLLISFALNTQRYAHIRIDRELNEAKRSLTYGAPPGSTGAQREEQQERIAQSRRKVNLGTNGHRLNGENGEHHEEDGRDGFADDNARPTFGPRHPTDASKASSGDEQGRPSYLRSPYWWLGLVLMIVGEAGNFLAYGFAPASIVSPLGVVALISNCLIAPLMLKEKFRKRDFWGVLIAIAGAVVVVLSARTSEEKFGPGELWRTIKRWEFLLYVIITMLFIVGLLYAEPQYGRRTILVDLGLVALFGGYTALSTKGVASLLSASLWKAFTYPITYFLAAVLVGSALMQIRYLNRALQTYDSTQVIPTQFVLFTLSVIVGSAVLYRDFEHTTSDQAVKFVVGCLLTFFGVYLITSAREEARDPEEDGQDHRREETIQLLDEDDEEVVDERTPLTKAASRPSTARGVTIESASSNAVEEEDTNGFATPRPSFKTSSSVPSIAVTPADESDSNPWLSSVEEVDMPLPSTPQADHQGNDVYTPFFTPGTSRPLARSSSLPADAESAAVETPSKPATALFSSPADIPAEDVRRLARSTRGSISRLIPTPGPLLAPLSSSLSALVADSLLRGEGASPSVRAALSRSRSARHASDERRHTVVAVADEDDPLGLSPDHLRRANSHEPHPAVSDDGDVDDLRRRKTRLRALSEMLSGVMGRRKASKPNDDDHHDGDPDGAGAV